MKATDLRIDGAPIRSRLMNDLTAAATRTTGGCLMRTYRTLVMCPPTVCGVAREECIDRTPWDVDEVSTIEQAEALVVIGDPCELNLPWPEGGVPANVRVHVTTAKPGQQRHCNNPRIGNPAYCQGFQEGLCHDCPNRPPDGERLAA